MEIQVTEAGWYDSDIVFDQSVKISKPRTATEYEIEYFPADEGNAYICGVPHLRNKGSIIVVKPGEQRQTELPMRCYYVHVAVSCEHAQKRLNALPTIMKSTADQAMCSVLRNIAIAAAENDLFITNKLIYELFTLLEQQARPAQRPGYDQVIKAAISYMEKNFKDKLTLQSIASSVFLSPVYFHNKFTSAVGITPHEYLESYRIKQAKNLLITSSKSISLISEECGFSSLSYFNIIFKKREGLSPNAFRKKRHMNIV